MVPRPVTRGGFQIRNIDGALFTPDDCLELVRGEHGDPILGDYLPETFEEPHCGLVKLDIHLVVGEEINVLEDVGLGYGHVLTAGKERDYLGGRA